MKKQIYLNDNWRLLSEIDIKTPGYYLCRSIDPVYKNTIITFRVTKQGWLFFNGEEIRLNMLKISQNEICGPIEFYETKNN